MHLQPGWHLERLNAWERNWFLVLVIGAVLLGGCGDGGPPGAVANPTGLIDCDGVAVPVALLDDSDGDGDTTESDCPDPSDVIDCDGDGIADVINGQDCPVPPLDCAGTSIAVSDVADSNGDGIIDEQDCPDLTSTCDMDTVYRAINERLQESSRTDLRGVKEVVDCGFDSGCGLLAGLEDFDGDGLSNAFEIIFSALTGQHLDPCSADTDGDGINDAFDMVIGRDEQVRVNMAVVAYESDDARAGKDDPYMWGGSWLLDDADDNRVAFRNFEFTDHKDGRNKLTNDHAPLFLKEPLIFDGDIRDWTKDREVPSFVAHLIVMDHDQGGNRGERGVCHGDDVYVAGNWDDFETSGCDSRGEPDPRTAVADAELLRTNGWLLIDLLDLVSAVNSLGISPHLDHVGPRTLDGEPGLVVPVHRLRGTSSIFGAEVLELDLWISLSTTAGNPLSTCVIAAATQASQLHTRGGIFMLDDFRTPDSCELTL